MLSGLVAALALPIALGCEEHESVHFTAEQMASYGDARPDLAMTGPYWTLDDATVATLDERLYGVLADHPDERFVVAGGGGNHFWQAVYDPGARELIACRVNDVR